VRRDDETYEDLGRDPWRWQAVLPLVVFVVAFAIIVSLVFSGAVQGHKTYAPPAQSPTTQPTVIIQP
jgi:hypothetical protein